ncbi:MAG: hypothetical protein WBV79_09100, partial [Rhodomicrobium sp.]
IGGQFYEVMAREFRYRRPTTNTRVKKCSKAHFRFKLKNASRLAFDKKGEFPLGQGMELHFPGASQA